MLNILNLTDEQRRAATVKELAEHLYPGETWDYALPQTWVDAMRNRGYDVVGEFVWLYANDSLGGRPAPVTEEAVVMASQVVSFIS